VNGQNETTLKESKQFNREIRQTRERESGFYFRVVRVVLSEKRWRATTIQDSGAFTMALGGAKRFGVRQPSGALGGGIVAVRKHQRRQR